MRSIFLIIGWLALDILTATTGWSHGVEGALKITQGWCVTAQYDDGEPMSYAAVEIKAPGAKIPFQSGRTDRNGRFLFKPDGQGLWVAVVTDGLGHRVALNIAVEDDETAAPNTDKAPTPKASGGASRLLKVMVGFSVIFGLFGVVFLRNKSKKNKLRRRSM